VRALIMILPGALFGAGLAISGMANPAKVIGFLDVTGGRWDPSLIFVMVGAIGVFALMNQLVHGRSKPLLEGSLPGRRSLGELDARLFIGASLFGAGWGLSGICPGPAVADISLLRPEILSYLVAMVLGMVLAQRLFGADAPKSPSTTSESPDEAKTETAK